jgi:hypothetical protein
MNMLMALGLGALWLYFLPRAERLDDSTVSEYAGGIAQTSLRSLSAPANELGYGYQWLRSHQGERSRTMHAVVRGILLAVPILLVFAVLLSTADAVFSRALSDLWNTVGFGDNVLRQALWMAVFAWFGCGVAACAMLGAQRLASPEARESDALAAALNRRGARRKRVPITLSMIETSIVLGGVIAMFAVFVAIQFRYFFGGNANIGVAGLTYAEYARRGFFELVAVAVLALGLLLALEWVTVRSGARQHRLFRGLALALVALVGVMMFSAYSRMDLYQSAYGYTPLRVYVSVFIPWLAGVFGFFVLMLFRARERIFSLGVLLCAIGFVGHLNMMNVEGTIAQRNIDRYRAGESLDGQLLWSFSVDAFAPMWGMYEDESLPDDVRGLAANWLHRQHEVLESEHLGAGSTVFSAHWARDTAYARLAASEFADGIPALGSGSLWEWYFEGRGGS